jgi:hypothetical protein
VHKPRGLDIEALVMWIVLNELNALDYLSTVTCITRFGIGGELNPILRVLFSNMLLAFLFKMVVIPLLILIPVIFILEKKRPALVALVIGSIIYFTLVANNFLILTKC